MVISECIHTAYRLTIGFTRHTYCFKTLKPDLHVAKKKILKPDQMQNTELADSILFIVVIDIVNIVTGTI